MTPYEAHVEQTIERRRGLLRLSKQKVVISLPSKEIQPGEKIDLDDVWGGKIGTAKLDDNDQILEFVPNGRIIRNRDDIEDAEKNLMQIAIDEQHVSLGCLRTTQGELTVRSLDGEITILFSKKSK